jgi:hypothetical protein
MPLPKKVMTDIWFEVRIGRPEDCWPFTGRQSAKGYGWFYCDGREHLCRNRICANPYHLEPVTSAENTRRSPVYNGAKTHCPQGHEYTPENTYINRGRRNCRECRKHFERTRNARKRTAAAVHHSE